MLNTPLISLPDIPLYTLTKGGVSQDRRHGSPALTIALTPIGQLPTLWTDSVYFFLLDTYINTQLCGLKTLLTFWLLFSTICTVLQIQIHMFDVYIRLFQINFLTYFSIDRYRTLKHIITFHCDNFGNIWYLALLLLQWLSFSKGEYYDFFGHY